MSVVINQARSGDTGKRLQTDIKQPVHALSDAFHTALAEQQRCTVQSRRSPEAIIELTPPFLCLYHHRQEPLLGGTFVGHRQSGVPMGRKSGWGARPTQARWPARTMSSGTPTSSMQHSNMPDYSALMNNRYPYLPASIVFLYPSFGGFKSWIKSATRLPEERGEMATTGFWLERHHSSSSVKLRQRMS